MPLPANVGTGTVTGKLIDSTGASIDGVVKFTPSPKRLLDSATTPPVTILPKPVSVTLDGGAFTTALVATNDPDLNPTGWTYKVDFALAGASAESFHIEVPEGVTVDLTTVAPVSSDGGATIIRGPGVASGGSIGQVLAKASGVDGDTEWIDAPGGAVDSVNGQTGVVTLSAANVGAAATSHTHTASQVSDSTTVGRSVLTATDAAAARTAIGAGTSNLALGTTGTTAKAGNYAPAAADISDSTTTGRSVLTAASASAARTAIGAGTSSLALGTTSSTAKAGDYKPPVADLPAGSTLSVYWTGSAWPARPTARTDVTVQWIGGVEASPPSGGVTGVDIWVRSAV